MRIVTDLDGVLAEENPHHDYVNAKPFYFAIAKLNKFYEDGHRIIIHTARYMGRSNGNREAAYARGYEETRLWLEQAGCKYHELILGKPSGDLYLDDRAIRVGLYDDWKNITDFVERNS